MFPHEGFRASHEFDASAAGVARTANLREANCPAKNGEQMVAKRGRRLGRLTIRTEPKNATTAVSQQFSRGSAGKKGGLASRHLVDDFARNVALGCLNQNERARTVRAQLELPTAQHDDFLGLPIRTRQGHRGAAVEDQTP